MRRLDELIHHSIYLIREAYANFSKPVLLWSTGKDSTVLLSLCRKAFLGSIPFPVIHIDTGHKPLQTHEYRKKWAQHGGLDLQITSNPQQKTNKGSETDKSSCCTQQKTEPLKAVLHKNNNDAVLLATRGDEHKIHTKGCQLSLHGQNHTQNDQGQQAHIYPLLAWTEIDVWEYIRQEQLPIPDLYFAKNGKRYRSISCECRCNPIDSDASTVDQIIAQLQTMHEENQQEQAQNEENALAIQQLRALGYM